MNQQDPKASKCWTCKHGLCLFQTQREVLFAEMADGPEPTEENEDDYDLGLTGFGEPDIVDPHQGHVHQIEKQGVVGLCYWKDTPLGVQIVHECNRYEKNDAK